MAWLILGPPWPRSPPRRAPAPQRAFRRRLLRWFRRHGRDLPWRRTRDPYQVLVSEFMLQQTQVSRVEEFYAAFLAAFPTVRRPGPRPARAGCGRVGRARLLSPGRQPASAGARGGRPQHDGEIPRDAEAAARAPRRRAATPPARWRASPSSSRSRRWTPTWRGCSAARSIPGCRSDAPRRAKLWETAARAGAAARHRRRGRSIRRSWSWERWSARRGWRGAGCVRCGMLARREKPGAESQGDQEVRASTRCHVPTYRSIAPATSATQRRAPRSASRDQRRALRESASNSGACSPIGIEPREPGQPSGTLTTSTITAADEAGALHDHERQRESVRAGGAPYSRSVSIRPEITASTHAGQRSARGAAVPGAAAAAATAPRRPVAWPMPTVIAANPPPIHSTKPSMWAKSQ